MYKLILMVVFTVSTSLYAQYNSASIVSQTLSNSQEFDNLLSAVQSNAGNYSAKPDLSDFKTKAQRGLDFMSPGSSIRNLRCEKLIDLSVSASESFRDYLKEIYKDDIDKMGPDWIENIISECKQSKFGIMQWEIVNNGIQNQVKSIAVFDEKWNVLYDTELADFIVYSESDDIVESDNNSLNEASAIKNQDSQTKSRSILLSNAFGSVLLHYQARVTAIVSPYITASTNDAEYNYYTEFINCWRGTTTNIPPDAEPFLYFGTGGTYTLLYTNATPSESPITITGGANDRFNTGTYTISGANGLNWSFSFDFSVDFPGGGIGITPISSISPLSLNANSNSSINMLNYVYNHNVATGDVRAVFFDGGSLNADNFKILTGSGAGEIGKINITSKLRAGYMAPSGALVVPNFWSETSAAFNFPVQYLRGDHVLQPAYKLTSTRYNIPIGQIDTLKAKIINNSHAVNLNGGNISIDVSSLQNKLTLLSIATLPIGSIDTSASKEFKFVVRGNENGIVTPQVNISAMGWGSPVPPSILINNITSIDSNIDVSPLIKTLTLTLPVQGFYNAVTSTMISDTVRVYLRNASLPFGIADSAKAYLNIFGEGIFSFSRAVNFTQYYIQTKHRNSIETWSKTAQFFINSVLSYDFSTANTQAYGDNMTQVDDSPVRFAQYNGDFNQDGFVNLSDILDVYNAASNFINGYVVSDMNGDNITDLTDVIITNNNSNLFVSVIRP